MGGSERIEGFDKSIHFLPICRQAIKLCFIPLGRAYLFYEVRRDTYI